MKKTAGPIPPTHADDVNVVVESKSFAAFDQWMDEQLAQLVERWAPLAAPNASRVPSALQRGAEVE